MACLSTSCFCHNPQPLLVQNSPELKLLGSGLRLGLPLCPTPGPAHGTWAVTCSVDKKGRLLPSRMLCLICVCLFVEAGVGGLFVFAWLMLWELSCYLALFRCLGWGYSARNSSLPPLEFPVSIPASPKPSPALNSLCGSVLDLALERGAVGRASRLLRLLPRP